MTPALLLTAALAAAQPPAPPPPPPAPANAPKGLAPGLTFVTTDDGGRVLGLTFIQVPPKDAPKGGQLEKAGPPEVQAVMLPFDERSLRVTTADGKPVAYADAAKRVKGGAVVALAFAFGGKTADPAYFKALKDDVLVFEVTPPPPPGPEPKKEPAPAP